MLTGNPCSNGRIRLKKDPAFKQALAVAGIKVSIDHYYFLYYNTKLTDYSLNNQEIKQNLSERYRQNGYILFILLIRIHNPTGFPDNN
jgi:hypothetical protein